MAKAIEGLAIQITGDPASFGGFLGIAYVPIAGGQRQEQLKGSVSIGGKPGESDPATKRMIERVRTVTAILAQYVNREPQNLEVDGLEIDMSWSIAGFSVDAETKRVTVRKYGPRGGDSVAEFLESTALPPEALVEIEVMLETADRLAWMDLRRSVGLPAEPVHAFISYRSSRSDAAEKLANRLVEEGITPWFDRWDIIAGDSIPGKIDEGFDASAAFVPMFSNDYTEGSWCTEELNSAIAKRINTGFRIIPVLLEKCQLPSLISHLRHVDLSSGSEEAFDLGVREIVDAITGVSRRPTGA